MKFQDALFNWLQIRIVADARPEDKAASDTADFFTEILRDDHHLDHIAITTIDESTYHIQYEADGVMKEQMFPRVFAEQLLTDINENPKYNNCISEGDT